LEEVNFLKINVSIYNEEVFMKLKKVKVKSLEGKTIKRIVDYPKFILFHFTDGTSYIIFHERLLA